MMSGDAVDKSSEEDNFFRGIATSFRFGRRDWKNLDLFESEIFGESFPRN